MRARRGRDRDTGAAFPKSPRGGYPIGRPGLGPRRYPLPDAAASSAARGLRQVWLAREQLTQSCGDLFAGLPPHLTFPNWSDPPSHGPQSPYILAVTNLIAADLLQPVTTVTSRPSPL